MSFRKRNKLEKKPFVICSQSSIARRCAALRRKTRAMPSRFGTMRRDQRYPLYLRIFATVIGDRTDSGRGCYGMRDAFQRAAVNVDQSGSLLLAGTNASATSDSASPAIT
ncbi:hypothetical protein CO709_18265 [Burkholderia thailandensis]|nr:hypothetical protein CO709_18265 [Burkholderia thailandensis]